MSYVEIPLWRLAGAALFVLLPLWLSRRTGLGLGREILWGALRGGAQLVAVGYLLVLLFAREQPWWVFALLSVMLFTAAWTSARRVQHGPPARVLLPYALLAVLAGAAVALVPMLAFIVPVRPWFSARLLVPLAGMMLSSAMNVVALVFERLFALAHAESAVIEQWLALGASPAQALAPARRAAVRAAMLPTLNTLLTVGLVSLPGIMTGQILGGVSPDQAVRYQLVILYQLVSVAIVSGLLAAAFAQRLLFTPREQLVVPTHG